MSVPDCALLLIFQHLDQESMCLGARMVCARWRILTFDRSLWRHVSVPSHFSDNRLYLLMTGIHQFVEELNLHMCERLTNAGLLALTKFTWHNLKRITFPEKADIAEELLLHLAKSCPNLREANGVRTSLCRTDDPFFYQRLFPKLSVLNDQLHTPKNNLAPHLLPRVEHENRWTSIVKAATSGEHITRYHCVDSSGYLSTERLTMIPHLLPKLRSLDLCTYGQPIELQSLFTNLRQSLYQLSLRGRMTITDDMLETLGDNCPELKYLHISDGSRLTNNGLLILIRRFTNISTLKLKCANFDGFITREIGVNLKQLTSVAICDNSAITFLGLCHVVEGCQWLSTVQLSKCNRICDKALKCLTKCRFIRTLILKKCRYVSPKGLVQCIMLVPTLTNLTFVGITNDFYRPTLTLLEETRAQMVNESGICRSRITKLNVTGVGSDFICAIASLCPDLRVLRAVDWDFLQDRGLIHALGHYGLLQNLSVSAMTEDVGDFLHAVSEHALCLQELSFVSLDDKSMLPALLDVIKCARSLRCISVALSTGNVDVDMLVEQVKRYHGGHCCMTVNFRHERYKPCLIRVCYNKIESRRLILHFTPIKYLTPASGITSTTRRRSHNKCLVL